MLEELNTVESQYIKVEITSLKGLYGITYMEKLTQILTIGRTVYVLNIVVTKLDA